MGFSLKLTTMYKISDAQEPTNTNAYDKECCEIKAAMSLIEQGREWKNPNLVRRGWRMLWKIRIRRLKAEELTEQAAWLLANRRTLFIQEVEKRNNGQI